VFSIEKTKSKREFKRIKERREEKFSYFLHRSDRMGRKSFSQPNVTLSARNSSSYTSRSKMGRKSFSQPNVEPEARRFGERTKDKRNLWKILLQIPSTLHLQPSALGFSSGGEN
jgi:hypothetical protein